MSATPSPIYGCAEPAGVRVLDRSDLPPALRASVRALQRLEPRRNARLLVFVAIWVAGGATIVLVHGFLLRAAGCLAVAAAFVGLSIFMHEGSHGALFRSRRLSRLAGFLCGIPVLISASAYRAIHLRHHAHEHSAEDPDDIEAVAPKRAPLVLVYYALLLLGTYLYFPHVALGGLRIARGRERLLIALEYLLIVTVHGTAWWLVPARTMVGLWLLPMVVAAQVTNIRSIAEHGLTTGGSPFTATRTVVSNRVVAWLFCNLNYHLEHHLFPAVPWYNLPRLHRLLVPWYRAAGSSVYRSYTEFMRDFLRTTWSGVIPNVRLIPAHLREDLCA